MIENQATLGPALLPVDDCPAGAAAGARSSATSPSSSAPHRLSTWAILHDEAFGVAVHDDLTYTAILEVAGTDPTCMDSASLDGVIVRIRELLDSIPPFVTLQFMFAPDRERSSSRSLVAVPQPRSEAPGGHLLLALSSVEGPLALRRRATRRLRRLGAPNTLGITAQDHQRALKRLRDLVEQVARRLRRAEQRTRVLRANEVCAVLGELLYPSSRKALPVFCKKPVVETSRPSPVLLHIDGTVQRFLRVTIAPRQTRAAMLDPLLEQLPPRARLHLAFRVDASAAASAPMIPVLSPAPRDVTGPIQPYRNAGIPLDAESLATGGASQRRLLQMAFSICLAVDATEHAAEELEEQARMVGALVYRELGASLVNVVPPVAEFLSAIPGHAHRSRQWVPVTAEQASHLVPAWRPWMGARSPLVVVQHSRGHLVGIDPFSGDLETPHAVLVGDVRTGSGACAGIIRGALAADAQVFTLDRHGGYRHLAEELGGSQIAYSLHRRGEQSLSPFFAPASVMIPGGSLDARQLQLMVSALECMLCDDRRPELTLSERDILVEAIGQVYRAAGDRTPFLADLIEALRVFGSEHADDVASAKSLGHELRVWTEGVAGLILNRAPRPPATAQLMCFDLKRLEPNPKLQAIVALLVLTHIIHQAIQNPSSPKLVFLDELWPCFETPASMRMLGQFYRSARKYQTAIVAVARSPHALSATPLARLVAKESSTAYLVHHSHDHRVTVDEFHLNRREAELLAALDPAGGEALILHGERHFVARFLPDGRPTGAKAGADGVERG